MPTVVGPWYGGSSKARIEIDYSVSYNADQTNAYFSGMVYLATQFSITDNYNTWAVSGDLGSASGSNKSIVHGSSGGRTAIKSLGGWKQGNAVINSNVAGLEAIGVTVYGNGLVLSSGNLAPYITGFGASSVGQTSFVGDIYSVNSNGGALVNAQVGYNTTPSDTGATYVAYGSWPPLGDVPVSGLLPGTLYHFKMRVRADPYTWGPWTTWKTFTTLPGLLIRDGGVWKPAIPYVKDGGVWKQAVRYVKDGGVWK